MAVTKKSLSGRIWAVAGVLATISGALAFRTEIEAAFKGAAAEIEDIGTVELAASYEGETWRPAKPEQIGWLLDSWRYPTLRGFKSTFRMSGDVREQQNDTGYPENVVTEWAPLDAYVSNRGMLRLHDRRKEWYVNFIAFEPGDVTEYRENTRSVADDGSVSSDSKRLALNCRRCTVGAVQSALYSRRRHLRLQMIGQSAGNRHPARSWDRSERASSMRALSCSRSTEGWGKSTTLLAPRPDGWSVSSWWR